MNKEEFFEYRQELVRAFKRRTPNTESLEILRLARRFGDPNLVSRLEPEFRDMANPERAFPKAATSSDREYMDAIAAGYLFLVLMQEVGFEIDERERPLMDSVLGDVAHIWTPEGMD